MSKDHPSNLNKALGNQTMHGISMSKVDPNLMRKLQSPETHERQHRHRVHDITTIDWGKCPRYVEDDGEHKREEAGEWRERRL